VPVKLDKKGCKVLHGRWEDFYTGEVYTNPNQLTVDHVVPVKAAHKLSIGQWDKTQRNRFYNDMDNLVLTSRKNNSSKSDNDITVWQPANKQRACRQMQIWLKVKKKYNFEITQTEHEYAALLPNCAI
jgi:hypothetical protein